MLKFNPYFRAAAAKILKSSYFDDVRIPCKEEEPSGKVVIPLDLEQDFDYELLCFQKYTVKNLEELIIKEIVI